LASSIFSFGSSQEENTLPNGQVENVASPSEAGIFDVAFDGLAKFIGYSGFEGP